MSELRRRLLNSASGGIPRDGLVAEYLFNNTSNRYLDTSGNELDMTPNYSAQGISFKTTGLTNIPNCIHFG